MDDHLGCSWLRTRHALTDLELDLVLMALAPEVDLRRYERIYGPLLDDLSLGRPLVGLVLDLLAATPEERPAILGRPGARRAAARTIHPHPRPRPPASGPSVPRALPRAGRADHRRTPRAERPGPQTRRVLPAGKTAGPTGDARCACTPKGLPGPPGAGSPTTSRRAWPRAADPGTRRAPERRHRRGGARDGPGLPGGVSTFSRKATADAS
ncbi:hypothetical protein [Streptomyces bobili]|uniref:hypothetical protein n=1 Tax=Streptomyces bobili TaxID=67280 RepID=UPI00372024A5